MTLVYNVTEFDLDYLLCQLRYAENSSKTTRRKQLVENNSPKREVGKLVEN